MTWRAFKAFLSRLLPQKFRSIWLMVKTRHSQVLLMPREVGTLKIASKMRVSPSWGPMAVYKGKGTLEFDSVGWRSGGMGVR